MGDPIAKRKIHYLTLSALVFKNNNEKVLPEKQCIYIIYINTYTSHI